jgi:hypothetical protein
MARTTQLTISAESKVGVLAAITRAVARAGVNITAINAAEAAGRGKVRLIVSDPDRAASALKAAKFRVGRESALVLTLADRPGVLAEAAEKLARARVNIRTAYATVGGGGQATVVLVVSNPETAERALGA